MKFTYSNHLSDKIYIWWPFFWKEFTYGNHLLDEIYISNQLLDEIYIW